MSRRLYRFLHKHPEDPSEVPNGFLSDINPVSASAEHLFGLTEMFQWARRVFNVFLLSVI